MFRSSRATDILAGVALAVTCGLVISRFTSAPTRAVSRDALLATFDSDIRSLVYRWTPDDPGSNRSSIQ
jgi:hypothetical protein